MQKTKFLLFYGAIMKRVEKGSAYSVSKLSHCAHRTLSHPVMHNTVRLCVCVVCVCECVCARVSAGVCVGYVLRKLTDEHI